VSVVVASVEVYRIACAAGALHDPGYGQSQIGGLKNAVGRMAFPRLCSHKKRPYLISH